MQRTIMLCNHIFSTGKVLLAVAPQGGVPSKHYLIRHRLPISSRSEADLAGGAREAKIDQPRFPPRVFGTASHSDACVKSGGLRRVLRSIRNPLAAHSYL
jgi:hypothetical protein